MQMHMTSTRFSYNNSTLNENSILELMLMQEIWSEVVATLKSQYDGLMGDSDSMRPPIEYDFHQD